MYRTVSSIIGATVLLGVTLPSAVAAPASGKTAPAPVFKACPRDKVWSDSKSGCVCGPGTTWNDGTKSCSSGCPAGKVQDPEASPGTCIAEPKQAAESGQTCPPDKQWSEAHQGCIVQCPAGKVADAKGRSCVDGPPKDAPPPKADVAQAVEAPPKPEAAKPLDGPTKRADVAKPVEDPPKPAVAKTVDDPKPCPTGKEWNDTHRRCVPSCPAGKVLDGKGRACVNDPKSCAAGKEWKDAWSACVPICAANQILDFAGAACHPIKVDRRAR
jgi:hypothetical protein